MCVLRVSILPFWYDLFIIGYCNCSDSVVFFSFFNITSKVFNRQKFYIGYVQVQIKFTFFLLLQLKQQIITRLHFFSETYHTAILK
jgi:hypothetical protein